MKKRFVVLGLTLMLYVTGQSVSAQIGGRPAPLPTPTDLVAALEKKVKSLPKQAALSRESRKLAYLKLLEGQRHLWKMERARSESTRRMRERLARTALQKAVEYNPRFAEAYTAMAELELRGTAQNIEDAIVLSRIATSLDSDNFGAHRFLARLYTVKSNLGRGRLNQGIADRAIVEWKEVGRLDPRNAEAWAFLSALYEQKRENVKRIETLRKWLSSAAPVETGFFESVMRSKGKLSPENAATQLGEALFEAGNTKEALGILTRAVADNPANVKAIDLLSQTLENADKESLRPAVEALRQAVFADPDNQSLVQLLAETIAKRGEIDSAVKVLRAAVDKSVKQNKYSASKYQIAIGDILARSNRTDEAIAAYRKALTIRGIRTGGAAAPDDKDFAIRVINKMVDVLRKANRKDEAERLLRDSRLLIGRVSTEFDKKRIDLLLEIGQPARALEVVKAARLRLPNDLGLLRKEALILVSLGKVEKGSQLVRDLIGSSKGKPSRSFGNTDFSNYLFLSSLYAKAGIESNALEAVRTAISIAKNKESRQIGKVNLAFIQQSFGRYDLAEKNLREVLKESPGYPVALNNLGYLLLKQNRNLKEALQLIEEAVKIEPRNPSYLDSLGWAYFKLRRFDKAETFLKKAFRFDSTSATILEHLGDVYREKGRLNEAKELWQKALVFASESKDTDRIRFKLTR